MAINPTGANQGPQAPIMYDPHAPGAATGGPGSYNFGNSQNPTPPPTGTNQNPFQVPLPTMPVSMNPTGAPGGAPGGVTTTGLGGSTVTGGNASGLNTQSNDALLRSLQENYGQGPGSMIFQFLQSGGGFNAPLAQQTVEATNKAMEHNIQLGLGNLEGTLGGQGISPDSSVAALETSNYESNALTQMNAIDANIYNQMWDQSQNRELSLMEGVAGVSATSIANQNSQWLTDLTGIAGAAGSIMGGVAAF
jgi:hypothetical protein